MKPFRLRRCIEASRDELEADVNLAGPSRGGNNAMEKTAEAAHGSAQVEIHARTALAVGDLLGERPVLGEGGHRY